MRYQEHAAPRLWWLWLIVLFVVLLLPHCWLPELTHDEARYALVARRMAATGNFFQSNLLGHQTFVYPLVPWFLALLSYLLPLNELTIRLIGLVPLGLLAMICAWINYRRVGVQAAAVTGAAVFSVGVFAFQKGALGEQHLLFVLLMNIAWLVWYHFGRIRKKWMWAWLAAHVVLCLAMLAGGFKAVFFFYFPLLWLRRPLKIRRRLAQPWHWVSLLGMLLLVILWVAFYPGVRGHIMGFFQQFEPETATRGYFTRFIELPFRTFFGMFPWIFLLWPTYCEAFRDLEKQPIFAAFLRTIVSSLFVFFWFIPAGDASVLLPLIGPAAILIGLNYDLLVRRYGPELQLILKLICWATLAAGVIAALSALVLRTDKDIMQLPIRVFISGGLLIVLATAAAAVFLRWRPKLPIWFLVLIAVVMAKMMWAGSYMVYRYAKKSDQRQLAETLRSELPVQDDSVFLLFTTNPDRFPAVWFYLRQEATRIASAEDLPDRQVVYVISENHQPIARNREWTAIGKLHEFHDHNRFRIWKGVLTERVDRWWAGNLELEGRRARVSEWESQRPRSVILRQKLPSTQPYWLARAFRGEPVVRFAGGQVLHRQDSDRAKVIGAEHTVLFAGRVSGDAGRQTILDISARSGTESVLERIIYDSEDKTLIAFARDAAGKHAMTRMKVDLTRPRVIAVRRTVKALTITVSPEKEVQNEHELGAPASTSYVTCIGATWDGKRFSDFLTGDVLELHIYNQAVSDERLRRVMDNVRESYPEMRP